MSLPLTVPSNDPANAVWEVPRAWKGETGFVIGGGPSVGSFDPGLLRGRRVIATNEASKRFPFADMLFFIDNQWMENNLDLVLGWPQLAVTASTAAKRKFPARLLRVAGVHGPFNQAGTLRVGRSAGHFAVSLAVALGCARVVMLGFDMRLVDGRSHFHDSYGTQDAKMYAQDFADAWKGWRADAEAVGCAIVNACAGSALKEFPIVDLAEELKR